MSVTCEEPSEKTSEFAAATSGRPAKGWVNALEFAVKTELLAVTSAEIPGVLWLPLKSRLKPNWAGLWRAGWARKMKV